MTKNTSVSTEPQRWMFAKRGMAKFMVSVERIFDFLAQFRETGMVAAEDMVPTAVK